MKNKTIIEFGFRIIHVYELWRSLTAINLDGNGWPVYEAEGKPNIPTGFKVSPALVVGVTLSERSLYSSSSVTPATVF